MLPLLSICNSDITSSLRATASAAHLAQSGVTVIKIKSLFRFERFLLRGMRCIGLRPRAIAFFQSLMNTNRYNELKVTEDSLERNSCSKGLNEDHKELRQQFPGECCLHRARRNPELQTETSLAWITRDEHPSIKKKRKCKYMFKYCEIQTQIGAKPDISRMIGFWTHVLIGKLHAAVKLFQQLLSLRRRGDVATRNAFIVAITISTQQGTTALTLNLHDGKCDFALASLMCVNILCNCLREQVQPLLAAV
jgi:hypothetical protein